MPPVAVQWFAVSVLVVLGLSAPGCATKSPDLSQTPPPAVVLKPIYPPKPFNADIPIYQRGQQPEKQTIEIGRLTVKALELEAGIDSIKDKARLLGADAVINLAYKRRFNHEYAQNLFTIDGVAVVWKPL